MGVTAVVFEERRPRSMATSGLGSKRSWPPKEKHAKPETSSNVLNSWFCERRETFPSLADADPDDLRGTEYECSNHFILEFAGPVSEDGATRLS